MPYTVRGDVHTHTLFSRHAYSTIAENVAAARAAGLDLLGSTDHFSSMLFPDQHVRNFQYLLNRDCWPRLWDGVTVLRGAEIDITGLDGSFFGQDLAVPESISGHPEQPGTTLFGLVAKGCDYLIASVHNELFTTGASRAQAANMYISALEHPQVLVLGHVGRSGVPFDIDPVLLRARDLGKLIEINEHSLEARRPKTDSACRRIAERCAELGVGVVVNSDAHIAQAIGRYPHAEALLEEIGFPEELIANRDAATFLAAMERAGLPRPQ